MSSEIRGVDAVQLDDYLRAVPGLAGLPTEEPEAVAWWPGPGLAPKFGARLSEADLEAARRRVREPERIRVAAVDGKVVGTSRTLSLELTIPGKGPVPMGGVTDLGVAVTHRRRGLLRGMMRALLDDCRQRGERFATLCASEGGIYGRFGFGPATFQVRWELERHRARFVPPPDRGRMELVNHTVGKIAWAALHDRIRQTRVGEVSAHPTYFDGLAGPPDQGRDGSGVRQYVLHNDSAGEVDGAAIYRTPWSPDPATAGFVQVDWLEASSTAAYVDLWALLGDLDLTKRVVAARRPVDEALRWRLADPRALRVTRQSDNLWIRLIDVPAALAERSYQAEGSLVLDVYDEFCPWNQGRWRVEGGPQGATCRRTGAAAELALSASTLAASYLGGVALGPLAKAGRIEELVPGALSRATMMLSRDEAPHTACGF